MGSVFQANEIARLQTLLVSKEAEIERNQVYIRQSETIRCKERADYERELALLRVRDDFLVREVTFLRSHLTTYDPKFASTLPHQLPDLRTHLLTVFCPEFQANSSPASKSNSPLPFGPPASSPWVSPCSICTPSYDVPSHECIVQSSPSYHSSSCTASVASGNATYTISPSRQHSSVIYPDDGSLLDESALVRELEIFANEFPPPPVPAEDIGGCFLSKTFLDEVDKIEDDLEGSFMSVEAQCSSDFE